MSLASSAWFRRGLTSSTKFDSECLTGFGSREGTRWILFTFCIVDSLQPERGCPPESKWGRWGGPQAGYCRAAVTAEVLGLTEAAGFFMTVGAVPDFTTPAANEGFGFTRMAVMSCIGAACSAFSFQALIPSAP
jgi:hypothetical protein